MIAYLDEFINYLRIQKRYSERTVTIYKGAVERFYSRIDTLNSYGIREFIAASLNSGISERSVNLMLSALSSFCKFLMMKGLLESNPVSKVYRPKEKVRLPQFYGRDALEAYFSNSLKVMDPDSYSQWRNWTMMLLMYATGMRRAEVANLTLASYDTSRCLFKITGKGSKEREIPVGSSINEKILLYLQSRKSSFKDCSNNSFFLTDKGAPLYLSFVNEVVRKELVAFREFSGKKSPHILRHSFATHLLNDGAELNSIKEVLGHSSLAATQVYTHNSFEQLKKIYITAHPRAKKRR